jgi:hypothetical protein
MMKGRDILIYLAIKYQNNWDAIYKAVKEKEIIEEEDLKPALDKIKGEVITIIDEDYPEEFKKVNKPPFVLFLSEEDRKTINDESSQKYLGEPVGVSGSDEAGLEEFIVKLYVHDVLWDEFELLAGSLEEAQSIIESGNFEIEEEVPGAFYSAIFLDKNGKELFRAQQLPGGDEEDVDMFLKEVEFDIEPRFDEIGKMDA